MRFNLALATIAVASVAEGQLHELARKAGKLYFGTAVDNVNLGLSEQYSKILGDRREFGQLTPANGQKWFAIEPEQGVFNFTMGDEISNLAKKNKQLLRCHNFVWHSQLAPWVDSTTWTKKTLKAAIENHIYHEAKHWGSQCYAWDVLNEALNEDGTYRNDTFLAVLGPEYIKIAFRAAAKALPRSVKLYYNDYNIETLNNKSASVRENIVKFLQDDGIRIDGIGLQSHFTAGSAPTLAQQQANMEKYLEEVDEVAITELDVRVTLPLTKENLAQQSVDYSAAVGACVAVDQCVGITVWDFYDPYSWVPSVFPGTDNADLWFSNFTKHPAYYGVVDALKKGGKKGGHHGRSVRLTV